MQALKTGAKQHIPLQTEALGPTTMSLVLMERCEIIAEIGPFLKGVSEKKQQKLQNDTEIS
jgi:hypothetical protein